MFDLRSRRLVKRPNNQAKSSSITATPIFCTTTLSIHYWRRKLQSLMPCPSPSSREQNPGTEKRRKGRIS
ncbi:hypothetical protein TSUD_30600 [Trifolium subterraneum]|uniref:Uncharacterized protein n=1 Tax=Trifolium subterraneum TaxID=3900 RepID=A0A2Z6NMS6_TRISU|nr:hypothetical protein TSUD_30600 [Trifolium subterraneum]